jgi:hypothetical protein
MWLVMFLKGLLAGVIRVNPTVLVDAVVVALIFGWLIRSSILGGIIVFRATGLFLMLWSSTFWMFSLMLSSDSGMLFPSPFSV